MSTDPARLDDVAAFAEKLSLEHLGCRDWRHPWDQGSMSVERKGGRYYQSVECGNCDTVRTRIIDAATGKVLGNRYEYPDGYTAEGLGRIDRNGMGLLRMEAMRRMAGQ